MKTTLQWDPIGERYFERGVSHAAAYPVNPTTGAYTSGAAWNGLTKVTEQPSGAEVSKKYANNNVYLAMRSKEEFGATIEAYTYPDELTPCMGKVALGKGLRANQQNRDSFGLVYRSNVGSDTDLEAINHYIIHIVYGCSLGASERARDTVNESTDIATASWTLTTVPVAVPGRSACAHFEVDTRYADPEKVAALESIIYGDGADENPTAARMPTVEELITMFPEDPTP